MTPTAPIGWMVTFALKPGHLETFKKLANEAIEFTRAEPGVRMYQWFLSPDQGTAYVHEWFADQKAAAAHATGEAVQKVLPNLMSVGEFRSIHVFGTPGPELAKAIAAFPITARNPHMAGFTR